MPQYRYRALAQGGEIVVGEVEAPSDDEVLRRIEYLGHLPIDTEVVKPSVLGRSSGIGRRLPKSRDVTIFLRQLGARPVATDMIVWDRDEQARAIR